MRRLEMHSIEAAFEAIVDSIRERGDITNSSILNGIVTVESDNSLKPKDVIVIGDQDFQIISAQSDSFTISNDVEVSGSWKAKAPYFDDGHLVEINKKLTEKNQNGGLSRWTKYPLVVLLQDISVDESFRINAEASLNFVIVNATNTGYDTSQRREFNFTPILDPIYNKLINKLASTNGYFELKDNSWSTTRRYYWGSALTNKNIFTDPLDAIEVSGLNVKIFKKC